MLARGVASVIYFWVWVLFFSHEESEHDVRFSKTGLGCPLFCDRVRKK